LLGIARALVTEPELLLLDEPVAGLNFKETEEMGDLILGLRERGMTIFLIEHRLQMIMNTSDRLIVLNFGSKIAEGAPAEIRENEEVIAAYLGKG
jgi:branched-chain amino acid transport system ATP-binding protein